MVPSDKVRRLRIGRLDSNEPAGEGLVKETLKVPEDQPCDRDRWTATWIRPEGWRTAKRTHAVGRAGSCLRASTTELDAKENYDPSPKDEEERTHSLPGHRVPRHRESVLAGRRGLGLGERPVV